MTQPKSELTSDMNSPSVEPSSAIPSSPVKDIDNEESSDKKNISEPAEKKQKTSKTSTNSEDSARSTPDPFQPGYKVSTEVLKRRREGRIRAQEKLQSRLDELGIRRTDVENNMEFTSIPTIPLINQKNYYTEYLKKDEQIMMIRDTKEKINFKLKQKKEKEFLKKNKSSNDTNSNNTPSLGNTTPSIMDDDEDEDEEEVDTRLGSKTIVIHPGSSNIRIGLATDIDPKIIPNVIAHKKLDPLFNYKTFDSNIIDPKREIIKEDLTTINLSFDNDYTKIKNQITSNFKERMRYYKRRILPQSNETCYHFNKRVQSESIPDHNDVHKIEYLKDNDLKGKKYVVGEDALKLENYDNWFLRSPFLNGKFNDKDLIYKSQQDLLGDIELILNDVLLKEFNIPKKNYNQYNIMLIVPNLYDKTYVESMIEFLLQTLSFGNISILQEGLSASFGTGISSGCIVDIGSSQIKICCVDDGLIIPNSQVELNYGGDDITRFFIKNLLSSQFPYNQINLNDINDWRLADELKQKYTTFQDANVAIQVYNFLVRKPGKLTEKFEFKCFDEVMISPMGLFYPEAFSENKELLENISNETFIKNQCGIIRGKKFPSLKLRDIGLFDNKFEGNKQINPESRCQNSEINKKLISINKMNESDIINWLLDENNIPKVKNSTNKYKLSNDKTNLNMTPLDLAIIESITYASYNDSSKAEKLYNNILLVGGSSLIDGLDLILIDRMHIWRSRLLSCSKLDQIIKLYQTLKNEYEQQEISTTTTTTEENKEKEPFKLNNKQLNEIRTIIDSNNVIPIEILSSSRDIDPSVLVWKGGSVYSRLKIADELWISQKNWDILGSRSINYSTLFSY